VSTSPAVPVRHLVLVTDAWHPQVNGVVVTLAELVRGLHRRGVQVTLIEPSTFRRMPLPGYPGMEMALWPGRQVARRLAAAQADAVHVATEGPLGTAAVRWCRRHGVAHTTAFHTRFPEILASALSLPLSWGHAWFRRWHRHSAGVMVPSAGMLAELRAHGYPALREWTHGVDLDLFRPVEGADLGLPRPVWLYVGRVSWEKNLQAFLEADLPGSKVVYGEGPVRAELERRHPQVHWRGVVPRETLPAIYSAADVFVFPGRSETFGLVMLEAMAAGLPLRATATEGGRYLQPLIGTPLLPLDDEDALAAALEEWLRDRPARVAHDLSDYRLGPQAARIEAFYARRRAARAAGG